MPGVSRGLASVARRIALALGLLAGVAFVISRVDFARDMHRLDTGMLSGASDGSYHAIVQDLAHRAEPERGKLRELTSEGSTENIKRLSAAASLGCDISFGLVQDGSDFPVGRDKKKKLELLGRLPKSESLFFLGRDVSSRTNLASLAGAKIGVGPAQSGSSRVAGQIFALPDLASLGVTLSHEPMVEQVAMAERGELDLVALVIDEDAPVLVNAVREGRLQIAGLSNLDVIARRIPRLRTGRIGAGQYDAVQLRPEEDKRVLRVDTLVVTNGCAGRSATIDMLTLLADRFPDFVRHNKETSNATGLELAGPAKGFFEHGGPELADEFAPWLVDLMPPANWATILMAVSVLFNVMGAAHRFRMWRIDDARVKLEAELSELFGGGTTLGHIRNMATALSPAKRKDLENLVTRFEALGERSRRHSLSMLVPMGQEMGYRYQEGLIHQALDLVRSRLSKVT